MSAALIYCLPKTFNFEKFRSKLTYNWNFLCYNLS